MMGGCDSPVSLAWALLLRSALYHGFRAVSRLVLQTNGQAACVKTRRCEFPFQVKTMEEGIDDAIDTLQA